MKGYGIGQPAAVHGQVIIVDAQQGHNPAIVVELVISAGEQVDSRRVGAREDGKEALAHSGPALLHRGH